MAASLAGVVEATAAIVADGLAGVTIREAATLLAEAGIDLRHPQRLRMLHRFLTNHPQALRVAVDSPSPVFVRLAQTLHRHGHTGVPLVGCAGCGADQRPLNRHDERGRPVCNTCYQPPQRRCGRCGRVRPVGLRGKDGQPDLCTGCHQGQVGECSVCGRTRVAHRGPDGTMRCHSCIPRPPRRCVECGQSAPVQADWPIGPVCSGCYTRIRTTPTVCLGCGRLRPLIAESPNRGRICGRCAGASNDHACRLCGDAGDLYADRTCARCVLTARLYDLIPDEAPHRRQLQPLIDALTTTPRPRSMLQWLSRSSVPRLLGDLAHSQKTISHQVLDSVAPSSIVYQARSLLVETGVLPARVEYLDRLAPWLDQTLATVPAGHAQYVRQFANWSLLRRARSRPRTRMYTPAAADGIQLRVRTAIAFLAWLDAQAVKLPQVTQPYIDRWLADGPAARRTLRPFIQWARQRHLTADVDVPPTPVAAPSRFQDDWEQWQQLNRCLHEANIPLHVRVAGGLVLLFGLSATRLTSISLGQIEQRGSTTHLVVARHRLLVPPVLARLLLRHRDLAAARWVIGDAASCDRPLFPGLHGRPANPNALQNALKRHGIRTRAGRNTALASLAADLPPVVLADLLGIGITTAIRWAAHARRDWAPFLAERRVGA